MTLRDLTKRQLYNLRRRCEKERRQWLKKHSAIALVENELMTGSWNTAYNLGLKAGLEQQSK